jgi:alcohol dehydrogenase (cytochrome c)
MKLLRTSSRNRLLAVPLAVVTGLLVLTVAGSASAGGVTQAVSIPAFSVADLSADPGANWITHNGNLSATNHSSLKQINTSNVAQLQQAWKAHLTAPLITSNPAAETSPSSSQTIAYNGVLYNEDTADRVYATDAATGKLLWYFDAKLNPWIVGKTGAPAYVNSVRGLAIGDGKVYIAQGEDQVVAIDAASGRQVWANQVAPYGLAYYLTAAPLYYDGMVIEGTAGGDSGANCIIFALDAKTGKVLWHFNAIPTKPGMLGFNTWPPLNKRPWIGGGAVWNTGSVDPNLGLIYFGVGNPIPYSGLVRPYGAEAPTESVVALNVKTGKPAWYYQEIHHDIWDWDESEPPMLVSFKYKGAMRDAVVSSNKDGYVYVLDRKTGKPIFPIPETKVPQNAASHTYATQPIPQGGAGSLMPHTITDPSGWSGLMSPDGNPYVLGTDSQFTPFDDTEYSVTATPGLMQWQHEAYDPSTGNMFIQLSYGISSWSSLPAEQVTATMAYGHTFARTIIHGSVAGTPAASASHVRLVALNLPTNSIAWTDDYPTSASTVNAEGAKGLFSGVIDTAGGVLFAGRSGGYLEAYNDKTGALLWSSDQLAGGCRGAPSVYTVGGKEIVSIYAGSPPPGSTTNAETLYTFQLPG